jgi:hypothetical protein
MRPGAFLVILTALAVPAAADEESGLTLSDLAPYRSALEGKAEPTGGPAVAVTFRELWDHPERYQGRRVRVEGRIARRFRQGAYGTFPPLVEAWAVSPAGNPYCLVFPASRVNAVEPKAGGPDAVPGASVRFEGTYLKRVRYHGGDSERLAPLIVGDRPPVVTTPAPVRKPGDDPGPSDGGWTRLEWMIGLIAAAFVALALARRHLRAPTRRPLRREPEIEPAPEFVDDV